MVQADGSVNQYDRPWRGSPNGQPDDDFLDEVQESQDGQPLPVTIEVFEGPPLTVTASASQTTVAAGATVSFTANVSPAGSAAGSRMTGDSTAAPRPRLRRRPR